MRKGKNEEDWTRDEERYERIKCKIEMTEVSVLEACVGKGGKGRDR